jgi:hypothetical protein
MNDKLTSIDLDLEEVQILPEREALGTYNWANVWANNATVALNAASFHSTATAVGLQTINIHQY